MDFFLEITKCISSLSNKKSISNILYYKTKINMICLFVLLTCVNKLVGRSIIS